MVSGRFTLGGSWASRDTGSRDGDTHYTHSLFVVLLLPAFAGVLTLLVSHGGLGTSSRKYSYIDGAFHLTHS